MASILDAANGGATKTKIMYKAYLSYAQLKEYLAVLVENGLLEHDVAESKFKTTPKGLQFGMAYTQMAEMSGPMTVIPSE